ncbi:putative aminoacrylate peracid reductase RutC [compost metagenome]
MSEQRFFSGATWEKTVGYCRAIRKGNFIAVSGTTAVGDNGEIVGLDSAYEQTKRCFEIIEKSLGELNASPKDIIRTRIFTTDISRWEEIAKAHFEAVGEYPPAASMYQISQLIDERLLVEIEVDAIVV